MTLTHAASCLHVPGPGVAISFRGCSEYASRPHIKPSSSMSLQWTVRLLQDLVVTVSGGTLPKHIPSSAFEKVPLQARAYLGPVLVDLEHHRVVEKITPTALGTRKPVHITTAVDVEAGE